MYALPVILYIKSVALGDILEVTSNRQVAVVIIKASYFEVFIGVTHKVVIQKHCIGG